MGQAFISYSRRDSAKVYAICEILADAGFSYWLDKEDIQPPEQWRAEIVDGIKNSDSFILFISPASLSSPNVIKELNIASEQEHKGSLKIIPVILIPTEIPKEAEYQLAGKQWLDLSADFKKGLEDLLKILGAPSLPNSYKKHLLSHLPGTYITPELISPLPNPSKEVVVGKTINIKQIRDQRFMPRPKARSNALRELEFHLKEHEKNNEEEVFTFWIHGRSGSGKSVLLLQLLQEMVLQENAQAFWFYSDESVKIYDLFEKWAEQGINLNEPLFVFTDDFNTPLTRDLFESKSISSLLRNPSYSNINWPVIVTCSPPEYLEDFRNGGKDEGFRIKEWEIPTIDADESKQLMQWFRSRTGKNPKTGKAFEQSDGLVLSMLFELWYNTHYQSTDKNEDVMKAFGQRFKTRLDALNLTETIAPILALNRLYIWPPNNWLADMEASQRDALNILISDKDFSILSIEPSSSGYVRLTHPHLSDVIYQAIRPKNVSRVTRAHDLAYAFEKALATNIIIANQILRTVSEKICDEKDRLSPEDIDIDEVAKLFARSWRDQSSIGEDTKGLLIYCWVNWTVWNHKYPQLCNYLNESNILEKSLSYLDNGHKLWGEIWQKLWACEPKNKHLLERGARWLSQHQDTSSWSFVWRALLEHSDALPDGTSLQSLLLLGSQWLNGREDKDQWSFVWQTLLKYPDALPDGTSLQSLLLLGSGWLNGREDKDQWAFVWRALLEHPDALPDGTSLQSLLLLGSGWLNGREDKDQWTFVWRALLEHPDALPDGTSLQSLLLLGSGWLNGREDKDQWSFVWRALLEHPDALPEGTSLQSLLLLGSGWLNGREDKDQWSFVWQTLLKHPDVLPEGTSFQSLLLLGSGWLNGREDKDQWSFVWQTLLKHPDTLPEGTSLQSLLLLGSGWLNGREDKDQWSFVWQTIFTNLKIITIDEETFIKNAFDWLKKSPDRKDWNFLWKDILAYSPSFVSELVALGSEWVLAREDHDQWAFIWQTLLKYPDALPDGTSLQSLLLLGSGWLNGREDKDQWSFVWQTLLKHPDALPEGTSLQSLLLLGSGWLNGREDKGDWSFVWRALLEHPDALPDGTSLQSLLLLGSGWLNGREDKDQWSFVWRALLEHPDALPDGTSLQSLLLLGSGWLNGREDKDQWAFVWRALLEHPDALPEGTSLQSLLLLGSGWLNGREDKDQWTFVWRALLEHPDALPDGTSLQSLLLLGSQWLNGREDKDQWSFVWRVLLEHPGALPEDTSLLQRGMQWLNGREDKDQWAFVWQKIFRNIDSNNKALHLIDTGLIWLRVSQIKNDWPFIWEDLLKNRLLPKDIKNEVLNLGIEWLKERESHQSWSFVFENCLRNRAVTQELLTEGIQWISSNENRQETPGIAFEIVNYYDKLAPSERNIIHKWIKSWVYQSHPKNKGWSYGWAAYWKIMPSVETVDLALKWIEVNPEYTDGTRWIIKTLLQENRPDINIRLIKWLERYPDHPISETIKKKLIT